MQTALPEWIMPAMLGALGGVGGWIVRQFARRLEIHEGITQRLLEEVAQGRAQRDDVIHRLMRIEDHEDGIRQRIDRLLERGL